MAERVKGWQAKTIKSVLRRKTEAWLHSIEDESVRNELRESTIVTGGCIASMLLGEKVNDFDIYFSSYSAALRATEYYVGRFIRAKPGMLRKPEIVADGNRVRIKIASAGAAGADDQSGYEYFENGDGDGVGASDYLDSAAASAESEKKAKLYAPVFLSDNAITLSGDVQIVIRFFGEVDEIHKNYDFVHCTNAWAAKDGVLLLRPDAMESLLCKQLRYTGSRYPLCSVIRTRKFIERGWSINAGQYLKMLMQVSALDLTDVFVLEDQLTGVDFAYFREIIDCLKADMQAKGTKQVEATYLAQLIDRIF